MSAAADLEARRSYRDCARRLRERPEAAATHLARLDAALAMDGAEPVQGALADLFAGLPAAATGVRQAALRLAAPRLGPHVADAFERHAHGHPLPRVHPLATRWSVLVQPSAEVPARVRRGSPDASRRLADDVVAALCDGAPVEANRVERAFLDHCVSCQDKLAFMLATRELRRREVWLGADWRRAEAWLQQCLPDGARAPDAGAQAARIPSFDETSP